MKRLVVSMLALLCLLASCSLGTANSSSSSSTSTSTPILGKNADLSALSTNLQGSGTLNPAFSPDTTSYTLTVPNSVTSITLTGTAADSKAKLGGTAILANLPENTPQIGTIIVTAEDGKTVKIYTVTVKRLAASISTNACLNGFSDVIYPQSLNLNPALSPVFSPTIFAYTLTIPNSVSAITISATPQESTASVSPQVKLDSLAVGVAKTATFTVTAQDGLTSKTYTIAVTRATGTSTPDLASIQLSGGSLSPVFSKTTTSYTVSVDYSVTSLVIWGIKANSDCAVTDPVTLGNLAVGAPQTASITVTNTAGTSATYYVKVTRTPEISTNADLSDLTVSSGTLSPSFVKGTTSYTVGVTNSITSVVVTGFKANANATATSPVTLSNLVPGVPQTATIMVTAQDGVTSQNYTVKVTRDLSSNALLDSLSVSSGTLSPAFNANSYDYTVSVANSVSSVVVTGIKADSSATATDPVTLSNLVAGNQQTATITVKAQNGTTTNTYRVKVTRELNSNADMGSLTVTSGTLSPAFDANVYDYTVNVATTVTSVTVTGLQADANATVSSPITLYSLEEGITQTATIKVTAQNGTAKKTYTIKVTRDALPLTALPAAADGIWSYGSLPIFAISGGKVDTQDTLGAPIMYDAAGNLYYFLDSTRKTLNGYTWSNNVIKRFEEALPKSPLTGSYTTIPASADGTWSSGGMTVFTIINSKITYAGLNGCVVQYDTSGNLFYYYSLVRNPITNYTWDGSVIRSSGTALTQSTSTASRTYTTLPAAANGTWYNGGVPVFTISNGLGTYNGVIGTGYTIQSDQTGNLYLLSGSTRTALSTYTWDGSVIKIFGTALTKTANGIGG